VFLVNVPVVALAMLAGWPLVPESRDPDATPLDPIGAILSVTGLVALVYGIIQAPEDGWTDPVILGGRFQPVIATTVIIMALVIMEVTMGRRPKSAEVRARFWSARASGATLREAARAAGVSRTTGHYWLRDSGGSRPRARRPRPALRLSLTEREEISRGLAAGLTLTAIARTLGRSPSTVSREVARNRGPRGYRAVQADRLAEARTRRPKPAKLARNAVLRGHVEQRLAQRWSPQQISARLVCDFPNDQRMRVSHETIYTSLFVQARGALRAELTACLRTGRVRRRPQRRVLFPPQRIRDKVMISQRPVEAADRVVAGHWEGDLIVGEHNKSYVGTLVERTTRYVVLLHLPDGPSDDQVIAALAAKIAPLPAKLRRSVTWDQGIEMVNHCDDDGGGCGEGLTQSTTGLVPLA
jgi:transposase, IS30 family